ncbi:procathepsin L-like [Branchiostoma lanceolatum]|uniref:procathepsin L-like n=1 Tax=Branchiostoma lanceolatum TaxID=7740 RepID=UPI00345266BD
MHGPTALYFSPMVHPSARFLSHADLQYKLVPYQTLRHVSIRKFVFSSTTRKFPCSCTANSSPKATIMWRFLTVCAAMVSMAMAHNTLWENYKGHYGMSFGEEEESRRLAIFENNTKLINKHNAEADMGMHTYTLGINQFAHMTNDEFVANVIGGCLLDRNASKSTADHVHESNMVEVPDTVDWRDKGYVTPVKDQAQCGSCWAFSTTGSLEGQHFKKTGTLVSLSEQQLVDCSKKFGNMGCNGGLMDNAFIYIKANGGIDTESSYPYTGKNGKCKFNADNVGATCTGYTDVAEGDEDALKSAVATVGPISVAIDASHFSFQFYHSGVYNDPACSTRLDHGVLAVGYGTYHGKDYWLVKNSWGEGWGLKGYIRMTRNKKNQCGIASSASYPLV